MSIIEESLYSFVGEHECYVYVITNNLNDKRYVGISNIPSRRFNEHRKRTNSKVSRAIRKYGTDNFTFQIVLPGTREHCCKMEAMLIEYFDTFKNGYNMSSGGEGSEFYNPWNKGTKGLSKPNKTSFAKGSAGNQKLSQKQVDRILLEYSQGIKPKQMLWLPVHWAQAYRVIKKHKSS